MPERAVAPNGEFTPGQMLRILLRIGDAYYSRPGLEHQRELAAGVHGASLRIIDRSGHNPRSEQPG